MSSSPDESVDVVIADDDALVRMVVKAALEGNGFRVTEAPDGEEAIRAVVDRTSTQHPVRVAVVDSHMPGPGLDALVTTLAAVVPAPSVVVLSGDAAVAEARLSPPSELPAIAFLAKPVELDELIDVVKSGAVRSVGAGAGAGAGAGVLDD